MTLHLCVLLHAFVCTRNSLKALMILTSIFAMMVPVLLCVAFFTLAERQIMASMQRRYGPHVSFMCGVFIVIAFAFLLLDVVAKVWIGTNLLSSASGLTLFTAWGVKTLPVGIVLTGILCALTAEPEVECTEDAKHCTVFRRLVSRSSRSCPGIQL